MFGNGKALVGNGMVLEGDVNGRRGIIRKTDFSQELLPGPSAPNFGITRVSARTFPENGFFRKTEWEKAVDTPPYRQENQNQLTPFSTPSLTRKVDIRHLSNEHFVRQIRRAAPLRSRLSRENHIPTLSFHHGKKQESP